MMKHLLLNSQYSFIIETQFLLIQKTKKKVILCLASSLYLRRWNSSVFLGLGPRLCLGLELSYKYMQIVVFRHYKSPPKWLGKRLSTLWYVMKYDFLASVLWSCLDWAFQLWKFVNIYSQIWWVKIIHTIYS